MASGAPFTPNTPGGGAGDGGSGDHGDLATAGGGDWVCDKIVVRLREFNNQIGYVREVKNRNAQVFLPNERRVVMVGTERGIVRVEPEAGDKVRDGAGMGWG